MKRIAALLALAWFGWDTLRPAWNQESSDFPNYYTAALAVRAHEPLNRYYEWTWFQRQMDFAGFEHQLGGYIPQTPLAMMPFLPLSYFTPLTARRVWVLLNLAFLAASLLLLSRITEFGVVDLWLLAFLGYPALRSNLVLGQYYVFLLLLLTAAAYCLLRKRDAAGGVFLAIAMALKLYGGPLLLLLAARRRWRAALSMAGVFMLLVCCAIAIFGLQDLRTFVSDVLPRALSGETLNPYHPSNGTVATMFRRMFTFESELNSHPLWNAPWAAAFLTTVFSVVVLAAPALAAFSKRTLAWWFVAMLLVSPNTASYTFVLLVLPVALLLNELRRTAWLVALPCYVLIAMPLWAGWAWMFPRVWLLAILYFIAGGKELRGIPRKRALGATVLIVATSAGLTASRKVPRTLIPALTQSGAIYSNFPDVSDAGLIYESIGQDRYVIRARGRTIAVDGDAFHPSAPASGNPIYFEAVSGRHSQIARYDAASGRTETVPVNVDDPVEPAVSRDGKKLAFVSHERIYVFDGTSTYPTPARGFVHDPSFSPRGFGLVYASDREIALLDLRSGIVSTILRGEDDVARPSLSPDGIKLLFAARNSDGWQVFVRDLAGGPIHAITSGRCNHISPTWGRNGREILFAADCARGLGLTALFHVTGFD